MAVRNFLARNPGELVAEFTEVESGCRNDRPKLTEALRLCRLCGATLLVARLDRLSRSVALISKLMESGAAFVAADMPEANRFTLHIFAAVAEYEAKLMSERRKAACAAMKARGQRPGEHLMGRGVHRPENLLAARAAQQRRREVRALAMAPLLRELRDRGKSTYAIAAELTRMEIATQKGGRKWSNTCVQYLFQWAGEAQPLKGAANRKAYVAGLLRSAGHHDERPAIEAKARNDATESWSCFAAWAG
jgi:DNA invertase Pin-like site-specific DNA recombinase